jgi:two-component system, NarL family, sensor histidine kinase BarA
MSTPIIDWKKSLKLAGNNRENALKILSMLTADLPETLTEIKKAHEQNNLTELSRLLHKLHGGLCYLGLPKFKASTVALEEALKNNSKSTEISHLLNQFILAADEVMQAWKNFHD